MPRKSAPISCLILVLAAAAVCAGPRIAASKDRPAHHRSHPTTAKAHAASPGAADITGTTSPRGTAPVAAAASRALTARARFVETRAAMERALLVRESISPLTIDALAGSFQKLSSELAAIERASPPGSAEAVKSAMSATRDWYQAGLTIISPPAGGVLELPLPMSVAKKADAAAAALDRLVEAGASEPQTNAQTPPSVAPAGPQAQPHSVHRGRKPAVRRISMMRATAVAKPSAVESW